MSKSLWDRQIKNILRLYPYIIKRSGATKWLGQKLVHVLLGHTRGGLNVL